MLELNTSPQGGTALSRPLEIGIGILHGLGEGASLPEAAKELVASALRTVNTERLLVRGVLLLATADWCRGCSPLPAEVRSP